MGTEERRFHATANDEKCHVCGKEDVTIVLRTNHEPMPFRPPSGWFVVRTAIDRLLWLVCSTACAEDLPSLTNIPAPGQRKGSPRVNDARRKTPWPAMAKAGDQCGARDPDEGVVRCTVERGHDAKEHVAHAGDGAAGEACYIICVWDA